MPGNSCAQLIGFRRNEKEASRRRDDVIILRVTEEQLQERAQEANVLGEVDRYHCRLHDSLRRATPRGPLSRIDVVSGRVGGLGDRSPPAGSRGRAPRSYRYVQCYIVSRKLVSVHHLLYFIAKTCTKTEKT